MAKNPESPERIFSEGLVLPDGRKVRVLAYDDGSVRFRLDGAPYAITEAFIQKGRQGHAIVKLVPLSAVGSDGGDDQPDA